jgi:hypothetical protein
MITSVPSSNNTVVQNLFKQQSSVRINVGCTIEYNMNSMLDSITVSYPASMDQYYAKSENGKINTYKKLFPIDSIIRPFRPLYSGVKYLIWTTAQTDTPANSFYSPRTLTYPRATSPQTDGYESAVSTLYPRLYYPGVTTSYKYWVTPINQNADLTVTYSVTSATVKEASSSGALVTYKTLNNHGFVSGQTVTVTGLSTAAFNLSSALIASTPTPTSFTVANSATGAWSREQTATATLSAATKPAVSNKIVARFEKTHALPSNYTMTITYSDATTATVGPTAVGASGEVVLYYNGTTWTATEPTSYATPKLIKSIRLQATNPGGGKVVGIIELSARWIKDITSDIVGFEIQKESSASSEDILPVGKITANNINIELIKYNQSALEYLEYNRAAAFDITKNYMVKNAELKPYFSVYHSAGTYGSAGSLYDKVPQGSYYIDSWNISEQGEVSLNALDGAKYLMETVAPDMLCESYPVTSIIRRLLDSIGFTNYEIRIATDDKSIPVVNYWWTNGSKTVWQALQELCRDIQMNAFFDENNILQFASRDYIYKKSNIDWSFTYDKDGTTLPNIVSFDKQEIPSANQVKILWQSQLTSNYAGNSGDLWTDEVSYLSAGGLRSDIAADTSPENTTLAVDIETLDQYSPSATLYNYAGYVMIDSEIIEYDAIQYQYTPIGSTTSQNVWVESSSDVNKYRYLSRPGYADVNKPSESAYFRPTGLYRVKTRGAFGTTPAYHPASSLTGLTNWTQRKATWE